METFNNKDDAEIPIGHHYIPEDQRQLRHMENANQDGAVLCPKGQVDKWRPTTYPLGVCVTYASMYITHTTMSFYGMSPYGYDWWRPMADLMSTIYYLKPLHGCEPCLVSYITYELINPCNSRDSKWNEYNKPNPHSMMSLCANPSLWYTKHICKKSGRAFSMTIWWRHLLYEIGFNVQERYLTGELVSRNMLSSLVTNISYGYLNPGNSHDFRWYVDSNPSLYTLMTFYDNLSSWYADYVCMKYSNASAMSRWWRHLLYEIGFNFQARYFTGKSESRYVLAISPIHSVSMLSMLCYRPSTIFACLSRYVLQPGNLHGQDELRCDARIDALPMSGPGHAPPMVALLPCDRASKGIRYTAHISNISTQWLMYTGSYSNYWTLFVRDLRLARDYARWCDLSRSHSISRRGVGYMGLYCIIWVGAKHPPVTYWMNMNYPNGTHAYVYLPKLLFVDKMLCVFFNECLYIDILIEIKYAEKSNNLRIPVNFKPGN